MMKVPCQGLSRTLLKILRRRTLSSGHLCSLLQFKNTEVSWQPFTFSRRPLTYSYVVKICASDREISLCDYSTSRLFISGATGQSTDSTRYVDLDLDIDTRLSDTGRLQANLQARNMTFSVEKLIDDRRKMMEMQKEKENLEAEREKIAKQMGALVREKKGQPEFSTLSQPLIARGKEVKERLKSLMGPWWEIEERVILSALSLPNQLHPNTPLSSEEVIKDYLPEKRITTDLTHYEILKNRNLVKFSNLGPRAYYMKEQLAVLEQDLIRYYSSRLEEDSFIQWTCPEIFKTIVMEGSGMDFKNREELFCLGQKDKSESESSSSSETMYLRGVSLASFSAYLSRAFIEESALPMRIYTVGKNYGPCNKNDLPGLFGGVQSTKACIMGLCSSSEESWDVCDTFRDKIFTYIQPFEIPSRLVTVPASCLHASEEHRAEVQMWVPSLQKYVLMGSVSLLSDYVSRRLMVRCGKTPNNLNNSEPVQMVYGEVIDISRLIGCMVEYDKLDCPGLEKNQKLNSGGK